jgi:hypothetical protein
MFGNWQTHRDEGTALEKIEWHHEETALRQGSQ